MEYMDKVTMEWKKIKDRWGGQMERSDRKNRWEEHMKRQRERTDGEIR